MPLFLTPQGRLILKAARGSVKPGHKYYRRIETPEGYRYIYRERPTKNKIFPNIIVKKIHAGQTIILSSEDPNRKLGGESKEWKVLKKIETWPNEYTYRVQVIRHVPYATYGIKRTYELSLDKDGKIIYWMSAAAARANEREYWKQRSKQSKS